MAKFKKILVLIFFCGILKHLNGQENICNINGKKSIHKVSEKFLSISIDPAVLLAGINLSETSLLLAKHLSPAYIRIAGPSTRFVQYVDKENEALNRKLLEDETNVIVTPSMWFGINEWLNLANLTPIYGINDLKTTEGAWDPQSTLPLLEISDKLNVSCYWQLGFDCSNKNDSQYIQDLKLFRNTLNLYPDHNETWKIVGSDISKCFAKDQLEHALRNVDDLKNISEALMWEPSGTVEENFPEKDMIYDILNNLGPSDVSLWTTVPKTSRPVSFASALLWAKQVGDAAKIGYEVVFREPRLHEMSFDTPVYWFTLLHKKLMGSNILDAKVIGPHNQTSIFCQCSRKQNSFIRRGAITILMVNNGTENYVENVKLGILSAKDKSLEVQSYILTSPSENSTAIFLNGDRLTTEILKEKDPFQPKLRRAKALKHITLDVPPKSIGFFVLPGARVPVCINEEQDMNLLLQEMRMNQNLPLSNEVQVQGIVSRGSFSNDDIITLEKIKKRMQAELESDEKYYNVNKNKKQKEDMSNKDSVENVKNDFIDKKGQSARQLFIERAKLKDKKKPADLEKKREEIMQLLKDRIKPIESSKAPEKKEESRRKLEIRKKEDVKSNIELTSEEMESILRKRAKAKASQRRIKLTSEELDTIFEKSNKGSSRFRDRSKRYINRALLEQRAELHKNQESNVQIHQRFKDDLLEPKFVRTARDINGNLLGYKARMEERKQYLLNRNRNLKDTFKNSVGMNKRRMTRDINMDLLKKKIVEPTGKPVKRLFKDKEEKKATIRQPGQTSEELFKELEPSEEEIEEPVHKIPSEVFAELATSDSEEEDTSFFEDPIPEIKKKPKLDIFHHSIQKPVLDLPSVAKPERKKAKKIKKPSSDEALQYLSASAEFNDIVEGPPCIHEYFGADYGKPKSKNIMRELWETDSVDKRKDKKNRKNKMKEVEDLDYSDDLGVSDEDFDSLRHKRDTKFVTKEDYSNYKKQMKKQLYELKQQLTEDKLKYKEEKLKNILDLAKTENKDVKSSAESYAKEDIDRKHIIKQLEVLKLKMEKRKDQINKWLKDDIDFNMNLMGNNPNINEDLVPEKKNKISATVYLDKRSLFDKDMFGNYKALTPTLKPWKPADILSLKKDLFANNRNFKALNEYNIFKNMFDGNRFIGWRRRRNVMGEVSSIENEIDTFMNRIENNAKYILPKFDMEKGIYELILPNKDKFEIKGNHGDTKIEFVHRNNEKSNKKSESQARIAENEIVKSNDVTTTSEPIVTINDEVNEILVSDNDTETTTQRQKFPENVQKIPAKNEIKTDSFIHQITEFFQNIGKKISNYFHHFTG